MSWKSPIILPNRGKSSNSDVHVPRSESNPDIEKLKSSGNTVEEVASDRFTCYICGSGWHFGRMKTITCIGNDETLNHNPIIYVQV